ncbi:MAG: hypothetical protein J7M25_01445 [Deltaproteobacteria bacterium]|nr:hypothetical protein [Deltaproteobacteria bacterium]
MGHVFSPRTGLVSARQLAEHPQGTSRRLRIRPWNRDGKWHRAKLGNADLDREDLMMRIATRFGSGVRHWLRMLGGCSAGSLGATCDDEAGQEERQENRRDD